MDKAHHPALFMVDTISSLGSIDYRHDEWGVDVTIAGSAEGADASPGMSFNAISGKALAASGNAKLPRSYWDWQEMLKPNRSGFFPYTPPTNLLYGLREALRMLQEEGLANVFRRHDRHAEATRAAVRAWGSGNRLRGASRILQFTHGGFFARRPRRGQTAGRHPRKF